MKRSDSSMADRHESLPPPELTMVDPRDPFAPLHQTDPPPRAPVSAAFKLLILAGAALLVLVLVGFRLVSSHAAQQDRQLDAEATVLRVQVVSAAAEPQETTGAPSLAEAHVNVTLRNVSPVPVRVLDQRVEGGPSAGHSPAEPVGAGDVVVVEVIWRLRCAEIGNIAGPPLLALSLRGPIGDHQVRLALPRSTAAAFHLAAVAACGTP
jgi:hypothetical protein